MNLSDVIVESARRSPGKTALVFGDRRLTYAQLVERVRRLARGLEQLGVARGDHVALIADNSNAVFECVFACTWIGAVCEQYNTRLSAYALDQLLGCSPADVLIASARFAAPLLQHASEKGGKAPVVAVLEDEAVEPDEMARLHDRGVLAYESLLEGGPIEAAPLDLPADAPCVEFFTSGTTGLPRGVVASQGAFRERLRIDQRDMPCSPDDVLLCVLSLFHVTSMNAYVALMVGAEVVIAQASDGEAIAQAINAHGVTRLGLVPFLMRSLVAAVERQHIELPTLKMIIYGGEPIDERFLLRCRDALRCALVQGYGMTETLSAITLLHPNDHLADGRLETAGRVVQDMQLRIVGRSGEECAVGERGEVLVRTPTLMMGYFGDEAHTAEVMEGDWYRTGDIGYLDEDGYLTLVDRRHNMVITGGENVYPSEVARCLRSWGDDVADVAVVGVPDARWGEALVAFVVLAEGASASAQQLIDWCRHRLGAYKKPRQVVFVDSLRRNSAGKVPKDYLQELTESVQEEKHG